MEAICRHCHLGVVQRQSGTWAGVVGPYLITLPQIEIQICDACGWVEYDRITLGQLSAILRSSDSLTREGQTQLRAGTGADGWLKSWSTYST
jgi:hypothetical protein